ncbi:MAG: type VI secretion system contractile sheath small subunit [Deltaproteobacteria bacterium]|jgi:type VI secretion system protein ImpB|nr:type VI secretion system contractile sheath small subunit [Deltaproteobacteria bacterium]
MAVKRSPLVDAKERVNIFYKSRLSGDGAETELPFKLLVLGDFTLAEGHDSLEDRQSIAVTKDNFNAVMKGLGIKIDFMADNHLDPDVASQIPIHLEISSLRDLEPDRLIAKVAPLTKLTDLRKALATTKRLLGTHPKLLDAMKELLEKNSRLGQAGPPEMPS